MADLKALAETLVSLSVKDVQELASILKADYGIEPAAAAVAVAAAGGGGAAADTCVQDAVCRDRIVVARCSSSVVGTRSQRGVCSGAAAGDRVVCHKLCWVADGAVSVPRLHGCVA